MIKRTRSQADTDRIRKAAEKIDDIRKRLSAKAPKADSVSIIRKFRDSRRRRSTS